jgi:hypothetical protein
LLPAPTYSLLDKLSQLHIESKAEVEQRLNQQIHNLALRILTETFGCLDDEVMSCWRGSCSNNHNQSGGAHVSRERICELIHSIPGKNQRTWQQLIDGRKDGSGLASIGFGTISLLTDMQGARNEHGDVLLTCLWLQNRLWHLALTHGYLTFDDPINVLRFDFAVHIADDALALCKFFSISSFESHGVGLVNHAPIMMCIALLMITTKGRKVL